MVFRDRVDAGRQLADRLASIPLERPVVLALRAVAFPSVPRSHAVLGAPLDVILVRKLGVPGHRELAMGAIGEGGVRVVDAAIVRATRVDARDLARVEADERIELERRAGGTARTGRAIALAGRDTLIVDDGLATGSTARAAIAVARRMDARRVVLAVPVAPPDTVQRAHDALQTTSSSSKRRRGCARSGRGTGTSRRHRTTRSSGCSRDASASTHASGEPLSSARRARIAPHDRVDRRDTGAARCRAGRRRECANDVVAHIDRPARSTRRCRHCRTAARACSGGGPLEFIHATCSVPAVVPEP